MSSWLTRRSAAWIVVAGLLAYALIYLAARGPVNYKGALNFCDFASPWASTHVWLRGGNPYHTAILYDEWIGQRWTFETEHDFWLALVPPSAFVVLAPLGAMPPALAAGVWAVLSIASIAAMLWATMRLAGMRGGSVLAWIFIAAALASSPVQTLLSVGQLSLPAIALILLAFVAARGGRDGSDERRNRREWREWLAGAMLAVAAALKPQLAAPFFLWFLFFARWRVFGTAVAGLILFNLIGILPMQARGIPWWGDWLHNIEFSTMPGSPNDPATTGPWRNQMIDLRVWLFTLLQQEQLVVIKALIVSMLLATAYVVLLCRVPAEGATGPARPLRSAHGEKFLAFATLSALALLPVYHRAYDAALLLPALAWALLALRPARTRGLAVATLLGLSVYLIPFDFLPLIMRRTNVLDPLAQTWVWRVFIFPHYAVGLLVTCLCLLLAFWQSLRIARRREVEPEVELEPVPVAQPLPELVSSRT